MQHRMWFGLALAVVLSVPIDLAAQSQENANRASATAATDSRRVNLVLTDVSFREALDTLARIGDVRFTFSSSRIPLSRRVSVRADSVPFDDVVRSVLQQTGVDARSTRSGILVLTPAPENERPENERTVRPGPASPPQGTVRGRVTDEASAALSGVGVRLVDTPYGTVTGDDGRFRIAGVPPGSYTIVAQLIGYADAQSAVSVADDAEAVVDLTLETSALPLDQIVATGTAFETEVRTLPNPISVITANEVQAKGATKLDDLLRGEIPGVMALSGGQDDSYSYIYVRGNMDGASPDLLKIYLDGVELADPTFLSTLDPKSIERIEVVRGPQASAIYGSEAASGVLQIFTKKGTPGMSRPRLELQASAGVMESEYTPSGAGTPLTQDYSLGVSGGGESFSYRAGAAYARMGEWVKHYGSETLSFSGGFRAMHGPLTAELTALWSDRDYDIGNTPVYLRFPADACDQCGNPDYVDNRDYALSQSTMALTLSYQATPRWRHTLTLGDDQNRVAYHQPRPSLNTPSDTFVNLQNHETRRRQVRYHTAYDGPLAEGVTARWTVGADYWSRDVQGGRGSDLMNAFGTVRPSSSSSYSLTNDGWWNAGYFGMAELGFRERLYVTLAARLEDNPNFGGEYGRAFVPRVGASYVQAVGPAEVKLRAQWGKGVRPPPPVARTGRSEATFVYLPNPAIAPEEKAGWDAGVDVYWGSRASFSITRYDEEAKNLIYPETIDAASTPRIRQYRNVGEVRSEGWEVEGELTLGRLTMSANYAYSDNVVTRVDSATAANPSAALHVGDRTGWVPKHSGGGRVTARVGGASVSVDASVMAGARSLDYEAFLGWMYGGEAYRGSFRAYYSEYPALWKWNLRADRALGEHWQAFLSVENLADDQGADLGNINVSPGRTTVLGVRWTH